MIIHYLLLKLLLYFKPFLASSGNCCAGPHFRLGAGPGRRAEFYNVFLWEADLLRMPKMVTNNNDTWNAIIATFQNDNSLQL